MFAFEVLDDWENRLRFHRAMPLKGHGYPLLGPQRINFTFRKAGEGVHS